MNTDTSISQVWPSFNKKYLTSHMREQISIQLDIANAFTRQFSYTGSLDTYHPAFLTTDEAAERQPLHLVTGDVLNYNQNLTTEELVRAQEACSSISPGLDEIRYETIKHLNHDAIINLLELYNDIWKI